MENGKDIADYAIDFGLSQGASYIEVRFIESRKENLTSRNGVLLGGCIIPNKGMAIRTIANGGMGFCSTANINKSYVEKAIKEAVSLAKSSKRKDPIEFSEEEIVQTKWNTSVKRMFRDVSFEEKQKFMENVDKRLNKQFRLKLPTRTLVLEMESSEKYIVNSEGSKVESNNSLITVHYFNTAKGKKGSEQRMQGFGGSAGWEWIEENGVEDLIVSDNEALVNTARNAVEMNLGEVDLIVSGEVSGIIAHENIGHPSEGDRILGREGAQAGESFYIDLLREGKLGGIKMGNDCVSVIDDPTLPGSSGFYLYDDECVKARPRFLIKDGKLNELLLNREYAHRFNLKSNGAARAVTYLREPITRMANTFFKAGNFTKEELFEGIKKGLYMKSFTEWNIDDRRFQSKYVGLEVYLIEEGMLTNTLVRRPVLELTTFGILGSIDAVSKDYFAPYGICGKGDPMQGINVSLGGPHIRLRGIHLGGEGK